MGVLIGLEKYKRNIQKIEKINNKPSHKSINTMIILVVIENSAVRPKIDSDLKTYNFCSFILQN